MWVDELYVFHLFCCIFPSLVTFVLVLHLQFICQLYNYMLVPFGVISVEQSYIFGHRKNQERFD